MLRFRPKLGSERSNEWCCCFCLHVRTGTILLGSWHLFLHLLALGCLAAMVQDRQVLEKFDREPQDWGDALPTPQSKVEASPNPFTRSQQPRPLISNDMDMSALVTVFTIGITVMLIYGAARGRGTHLLPFFCLQIFDFAITVLTATGYLCYLRSIHRLVAEMRRVPFRNELLQLAAPALAFVVLAAFTMAICFKLYCIGIVWRCYKYVTMRAHAMHSLTPFVISTESAMTPAPLCSVPPYAAPAPDYSSLLPDYEEAVKQCPPPPSYRAATLSAADEPNGQSPPSSLPPPATVVVSIAEGAQARV